MDLVLGNIGLNTQIRASKAEPASLVFDELIVKIGEKHQPNGIQLAAIAMGRLMVFTKHVGCYDTFTEMMQAILNMREPKDLLSKTEDLKQESA